MRFKQDENPNTEGNSANYEAERSSLEMEYIPIDDEDEDVNPSSLCRNTSGSVGSNMTSDSLCDAIEDGIINNQPSLIFLNNLDHHVFSSLAHQDIIAIIRKVTGFIEDDGFVSFLNLTLFIRKASDLYTKDPTAPYLEFLLTLLNPALPVECFKEGLSCIQLLSLKSLNYLVSKLGETELFIDLILVLNDALWGINRPMSTLLSVSSLSESNKEFKFAFELCNLADSLVLSNSKVDDVHAVRALWTRFESLLGRKRFLKHLNTCFKHVSLLERWHSSPDKLVSIFKFMQGEMNIADPVTDLKEYIRSGAYYLFSGRLKYIETPILLSQFVQLMIESDNIADDDLSLLHVFTEFVVPNEFLANLKMEKLSLRLQAYLKLIMSFPPMVDRALFGGNPNTHMSSSSAFQPRSGLDSLNYPSTRTAIVWTSADLLKDVMVNFPRAAHTIPVLFVNMVFGIPVSWALQFFSTTTSMYAEDHPMACVDLINRALKGFCEDRYFRSPKYVVVCE